MILAILSSAFATVDPACEGKTQKFDDQGQQDFLLNYFSLATTLSPLHAPIPHEPGHGDISLEIDVIPPLSCEQRLVLDSSKTEDTNKAPAAPRPRIGFSMPQVGRWVPYAGVAYVPPVPVFGTRNVILSGEAGVGTEVGKFQLGARYHATLMKTVAEIAGPFNEEDPIYDDFYVGSTFGFDLGAGMPAGPGAAYLYLGVTDVSTYFWIGDDGYIGNNSAPFFGPTASLGWQGVLKEHISLAGELYTAPIYRNEAGTSFGMATGRVRVGWIF